MVAADIDIEAMILWEGALATKMPLASEKGCVAGIFKSLRQGRILMRQAPGVSGWQQFSVSFPVLFFLGAYPVGNVQSGWILSGNETSSRRTANLAGGIALRESHAFFGNAVDMRAFVKVASLNTQISPAKVIGQYKDYVRLSLGEQYE